MQIVCESCGATGAAASVEVVDGVVQLRCAACGHANVAGGPTPAASSASPPAAEPDEPAAAVPDASPAGEAATAPGPAGQGSGAPQRVELPPVKCPKCGHRQHDDEACHRCGLVFAMLATGERPWERLEPHQEAHAPRARELWAVVEATPADAAAHAAFVDYCRQHDLLGFAAMRYRHWMADHPDDALSRSYLDRVVRDAQALVHAMSVGDDPFLVKARRLRNSMLVAVGLFCVVAMIWLVRAMAARGTLVP